jgi:hypothetical protein
VSPSTLAFPRSPPPFQRLLQLFAFGHFCYRLVPSGHLRNWRSICA